ncbi:NPC1-like intracellular cholesterol transporter 1 [Taenia solium]|eukprot:TsM_000591700 transcript=TsM_000591700 gene=TsM_000591700
MVDVVAGGAMTDMPAVRVFALYAGVAIVINFVLQIFAFTALLTLDAKRVEGRLVHSPEFGVKLDVVR